MKTREISFKRNGLNLYAVLYLPDMGVEEQVEKVPVVMISHGYNGSWEHGLPYAERFLEAGFAAALFDFCGGAEVSRSEGAMTEMSVRREVQDLLAVMEKVLKEPEIDPDRLFLFGRSQGGLVSAMAAAEKPEMVRGMILFYPAFSIPSLALEKYPDGNVPETMQFLNATIGRKYYHDAVSLPVGKIQESYPGPVLIIHGQQDDTVMPQISEEAMEHYRNAELIRLEKAGHGFTGTDFETAAEKAVDFLRRNTVR